MLGSTAGYAGGWGVSEGTGNGVKMLGVLGGGITGWVTPVLTGADVETAEEVIVDTDDNRDVELTAEALVAEEEVTADDDDRALVDNALELVRDAVNTVSDPP